MTAARSEHTATLLDDGTVLVTGGYGAANEILSSAELYDPSTGRFTRTADMAFARRDHTATLLPDGRVLIAGGFGRFSTGEGPLSEAEIYDPARRTFTPAASLLQAQGCQAATLLQNGKVLIAGGEGPAGASTAFAELFDPVQGTFSAAGAYSKIQSMWGGPLCPTATLLHDGRVLLLSENPAEVYDPVSDTFAATGPMAEPAYSSGVEMHSAVALRDGTVLMTGGNDDNTCGGFSSAEVFDPASNTFHAVAPMSTPRDFHTSTLLEDGSVLVVGGGDGGCGTATHDTAELYDPSTRSFVAPGRMSRSRGGHTATLLNDGRVLVAGGFSYWPADTARTAELYSPAERPHPARRLGIR